MPVNARLFILKALMKVIAGICRGRPLRGGHGPHFRPTAQIVKGSVFDTLYGLVQEAKVLDLYAGSGSLGIEALSRGADRAVFVEQDPGILRALRTNLERCGLTDRADVVKADATRYLERLLASGETFDLVFADPPYASSLAEKTALAINGAGRRFCRMLIVESGEEFDLPQGRLAKKRTRKFGQTIVTYLEDIGGAGEGPRKEGPE